MNRSGAPGIRAVDIWNVLRSAITSLDSVGLERFIKLNAMEASTPEAGDFAVTGAKVINGLRDDEGRAEANGQYCGVEFGKICRVYGYRLRGYAGNNNTLSRYSLSYLDEYGAWNDIVTGIEGIDTDTWGVYVEFSAPIITKHMRITLTTYDAGCRYIREVELSGITLE